MPFTQEQEERFALGNFRASILGLVHACIVKYPEFYVTEKSYFEILLAFFSGTFTCWIKDLDTFNKMPGILLRNENCHKKRYSLMSEPLRPVIMGVIFSYVRKHPQPSFFGKSDLEIVYDFFEEEILGRMKDADCRDDSERKFLSKIRRKKEWRTWFNEHKKLPQPKAI